MCRCAGIYPIRRLDCSCGSPIPIRASVEIIKTSSVINPPRHSRPPSTSTFPAFPTGFSPFLSSPALSILIQSPRFSSRTLISPRVFILQCHRGRRKKSAEARKNPSPIFLSYRNALKRLFGTNDSRNSAGRIFIFSWGWKRKHGSEWEGGLFAESGESRGL